MNGVGEPGGHVLERAYARIPQPLMPVMASPMQLGCACTTDTFSVVLPAGSLRNHERGLRDLQLLRQRNVCRRVHLLPQEVVSAAQDGLCDWCLSGKALARRAGQHLGMSSRFTGYRQWLICRGIYWGAYIQLNLGAIWDCYQP